MPRAARHILRLGSALLPALLCSTALAQTAGEISVERDSNRARILIDYADVVADRRPSAEAAIEHTVLIVRLDEALDADITEISDALGGLAARARLDADGRALRVALNRAADVHVSSSYDLIAVDIVPPGAGAPAPIVSPREQREREAARRAAEPPPAPPPAEALPVQYSVGQATEYTRLELLWPEAVEYELSQTGNVAEVTFAKPAEISLNRVSGSPPRFLESLSSERIGDSWVLRLTVAPGVQVRAWDDGRRVSIDLPDPDAVDAQTLLAELDVAEADEAGEEAVAAVEPAVDPEPVPAPQQPVLAEAPVEPPVEAASAPVQLQPARAAVTDPVPESGVVHAAVSEMNGDLRIEFDWPAPPGAAVFRRGDAVWIVFDAAAALDLGELAAGTRRHVHSFTTQQGADFTAARVVVPAASQPEVRLEGDRWVVVMSERIDSPPRPIHVRRDARRDRPGRILMAMANARSVRWIDDAAVGDRLGVITAAGPVQGLTSRRSFVGGALLPSAQGGAVEAMTDDIEITLNGAGAAIGRPGGLNLTPTAQADGSPDDPSVLPHTGSPAIMHFEAWSGEGYFPDEWRTRLRRASLEDGTDGQVALARFLLGNGLAAEALGMLDLAVSQQAPLGNDAQVRAMRGVASLLMERYADAEAYLGHTSLALDPAAQLWRGMAAAGEERWEDARRRFQTGQSTIYHYPPDWQARFYAEHARAALELGDLGAAQQHLYSVVTADPDRRTRLRADYVAARLAEAAGRTDEALEALHALAASGEAPMEAQALYDLYRVQLAAGEIDRDEAIENLENLRFRWRGDTTELETIRMLGELYVQAGEYARGLETMATAQARFPDAQASRRIGEDMAGVFRRLFLDGEADRMDPIEAVAVFYQYQHLAPVGTDGDRMIRRLADRLIAFDLLDPAAELLRHQVDHRLREPLARARVATDLAVIYLIDRRYEDAINVIRGSRVAGLPEETRAERYLLEARAYAEIGRYDQALELIATDRSAAADRLRADVAWSQRDWARAGRRLEAILGNRHADPAPLSPSEQSDLIRAAISYSLAREVGSARRLGERYGAAMQQTDQAAAFELLTEDGTPGGSVRFSDMAGRIASIDTLQAFMEPFRERFNNGGGPS